MSESNSSPVVRFLPSLADLAFIMPVVFVFARLGGARHLLADGDTGWHIRAGEWMLANGRVLDHDVFSFSKPGEPWFAWEWLWDVMFAWLHIHFGMAAVIVASMVVISFTWLLVFRLVRRRCGNPFIAITVTLLATGGSAMHWLARPHLFTMLFVAVFMTVLERVRDGRMRLLLLLPAFTVVWTNLHGGFFVGILLIGCYAAGEIAAWLLEPDANVRKAAARRAKWYVLAASGCAAASLVNPYTYHLHLHMYRFLSGTFHLLHIDEYQSTGFQSVLALWYEPMILLGVVAAAWSVYRKRYAHAFLLAGWVHLGLFSIRNMPIYLIIAAPLAAMMLEEIVPRLAEAPVAGWVRRTAKNFLSYGEEFGAVDRLPRFYLPSALAVVLITAAFYAPSPPANFRAEYDPEKYPARALEALKVPGVSGNVFTHDEWGDYLIYRLYPEGRVFVDGRFDFYGAEFSERYLAVMDVKYGWEETLGKYGIDMALLPVDAPIVGAMKESSNWRPVFDDGVAIVFRRVAQAAGVSPAGSEQSSAVNRDDRFNRDHEVTRIRNSDPGIANTNTGSESL